MTEKTKYIQLDPDEWKQCNVCDGYFEKENICEWGRCVHCCMTVCAIEEFDHVETEDLTPKAGKIFDDLKKHGVHQREIIPLIRLIFGGYGLRLAEETLRGEIDWPARKRIARSLEALANCYKKESGQSRKISLLQEAKG
ncbi:hypothetical protein [Candidatus Borrarchaeum sp.]|uniref:hypothetical protein n=1 Tax=Candidatus Borrarchaeum sp. TaxID=2846742 RepID=UPI00258109CC|nr:hypothetical protein [Candidatus Borrarchaeum sp.]